MVKGVKIAIATTIALLALTSLATAQDLTTSADVLDIFKRPNTSEILQGSFAVLAAYGLLFLIRVGTDILSEQVPRRFRLIIKQSVPFLKGIVLIVTIAYLLPLFLNLTGSNLLALTGTIAVALGFAFKDYASSIIAGVVNLFEGPFRMGDRIQIGDHYGEVIDYGLRGVRLQTPDDNAVTIPHNVTWTNPISNANSGQLEAQVMTEFYFAHEANTELAVEILYQAAYSSRYTQLKLPVMVVVSEETWATHLKLRSYPMDARDEYVYKTDLILRIKKACARHQLPYPRTLGEEEM
ncbi:mechanosensitive ion channel family protein [Leptothoe sp. ISB3NOV94-8A]|uniref:Mechanosensitive ion channel family protein n=1 Tax=Adonisia turfae CCMR0081 TaxID=2292702 RepID=A0A6M0RPK4_9CYAN|nr:mechanosensitive ion channel family protein [Adonisia turfae]MDV3350023.1 mechanosensitive ion channel family protein [Leptothoe sp. LEGE 181152]NEZ58106.1 mechanosensitive ion channel family protein [Adonisia turfae CCMR0081]